MQDFRRLIVWQRAHRFALNVRDVTRHFPRTGYRDLKAQITRAAESIASNIVEGCGAASRRDFARYLDISIKSACEVDYQLELARDVGVLPHTLWKPLAREIVEIRKMLSGLRRALLQADGNRDGSKPAAHERQLSGGSSPQPATIDGESTSPESTETSRK
jgi:four helix bundle protein